MKRGQLTPNCVLFWVSASWDFAAALAACLESKGCRVTFTKSDPTPSNKRKNTLYKIQINAVQSLQMAFDQMYSRQVVVTTTVSTDYNTVGV